MEGFIDKYYVTDVPSRIPLSLKIEINLVICNKMNELEIDNEVNPKILRHIM